MYNLYHGDCLEVMKDIPDNSIDCIICDLPYGMTDCKWDDVINYEVLWKEYKRVLKYYNANCILFCKQPFTTALISSNKQEYSNMLYWKKNYSTGFLNANRMPLQVIEEIAVFVCNKQTENNKHSFLKIREYLFSELKKTNYTPQMLAKHFGSTIWSGKYFSMGNQFQLIPEEKYKSLQELTSYFERPYEELKEEYKNELIHQPATFNPQGIIECNIEMDRKYGKEGVYVSGSKRTGTYTKNAMNYPHNLLEFDGVNSKERIHPTQKPVKLLEYLIKTYSNEGEVILDNCMGSGSTGVACMNTNRKFVGIEKEEKYFKIAEERIKEASNNLNKFMELNEK